MNYVKSCLIITMLLGVGYSQCDANGDGDLDVLDVVIENVEEMKTVLSEMRQAFKKPILSEIRGIDYKEN